MAVAINVDSANIPAVNFVDQASHPTAPGSGHYLIYLYNGVVYKRGNTGDPAAVGSEPALAEGRLAIGNASDVLSALALGTEGQLVTADASGFATWADAPEGGGGGTDTYRQEICPQGYSAYTSGVPTFTTATSAMMGGLWQQASAADQDDVSYILDLSAGTWTLRVYWYRYTNKGIVEAYLDASLLGSQDMYGTQLGNNSWTITGITVATSGQHTLRLKVNGKNASSSAYYYAVHWVSLWRTA